MIRDWLGERYLLSLKSLVEELKLVHFNFNLFI